ncbi:MAG: hypothetical protein HY005_00315 [Candidatus Staskawiczbacteria bacterium]|nr:hypothetical protein [Candidatus Staskawiczbacteria bacterium]
MVKKSLIIFLFVLLAGTIFFPANVDAQQPCVNDSDCTWMDGVGACSDEKSRIIYSGQCVGGFCSAVESASPCPDAYAYSCVCAGYVCNVEEIYYEEACSEDANGIGFCYVKPGVDSVLEQCPPQPPNVGPGYCVGDSIYRDITFGNCAGPEYRPECTVETNQDFVEDCGGCLPTAETRCSGSIIEQKWQCYGCSDDILTGAQCQPTNSYWQGVFDCGPPQDTSDSYCSNNIMCTLTVHYPGMCSSAPDGSAGACVPPTVSLVCDGACTDGGGGGGGGGPCTDSSNCSGGQVCIDSTCTTVGGGPCTDSSNCTSGQVCVDGTCTDGGGPCTDSSNCSGGQVCVNGTCGGGGACTDSSNCTGNQVCVDGACTDGGGGPCTISTDCIGDQVCVDGTCSAPVICAPGSAQPCPDGGTQTCDAIGQWGICDNSTHSICNTQQQCLFVAGAGPNQCQNDTDCANNNHNECNTQQQCLSVAGAGPDQCQNNSNCANNTHNECSDQQQCVAVDGIDSDQCSSDVDCANNTHNECNAQQQCVSVSGLGPDQCLNDNDCANNTHNECNAQQQCVSVSGLGPDQCLNDNDCAMCPLL